MADSSKHYVLRGDKSLAEGMTKEQILTAIEQAIDQGEITDVDTGFVTSLKEANKSTALKFWVGTQAQYNAISTPEKNMLYFITDDPTIEEIDEQFSNIDEQFTTVDEHFTEIENSIQSDGTIYAYQPSFTPISNKIQYVEQFFTINSGIIFANISFQIYSNVAAGATLETPLKIGTFTGYTLPNISIETLLFGSNGYKMHLSIYNNGDIMIKGYGDDEQSPLVAGEKFSCYLSFPYVQR